MLVCADWLEGPASAEDALRVDSPDWRAAARVSCSAVSPASCGDAVLLSSEEFTELEKRLLVAAETKEEFCRAPGACCKMIAGRLDRKSKQSCSTQQNGQLDSGQKHWVTRGTQTEGPLKPKLSQVKLSMLNELGNSPALQPVTLQCLHAETARK